jgi:hypothetical protein
MSQEAEKVSSSTGKNDLKNPAYEDQMIDWLLSEYQDETQLLQPQDLQNRLLLIENKVLLNEENLFLIKSLLKIVRKQLKLDEQKERQLTIIMLNFVEQAQKEQLKKIKNAHAIAGKVLLWTQGDAIIANTIFRTLLHSATLINSNYLENLTLWLSSKEKDQSQLLTTGNLDVVLMQQHLRLTTIENKFLVRSLVFNLRG